MIAVIDYGSQYTRLILRKIRELGVNGVIYPSGSAMAEEKPDIDGIILSGSPLSAGAEKSSLPDENIFSSNVPVLGICYGMQALVKVFGGRVEQSAVREYGKSLLKTRGGSRLFDGIPSEIKVWMSHYDRVTGIPEGFTVSASTPDLEVAAIENSDKNLYGVQFHPEVNNTEYGEKILLNFLFSICRAEKDWNLEDWVERAVIEIREEVKDGKVIMALSGGVDSSVVSLLLSRAVGDSFFPFFVDHGLMRKKDISRIRDIFIEKLGIPVTILERSGVFLKKLKNVTDPEKKRKIIGKEFITAFTSAAENIPGATHLAQGTIFPDVVESAGSGSGTVKIKSHHNVGGLPDRLDLKLLEPLSLLYKDEVRDIGRKLGLPDELIRQHPFPGPGLAVRIMGPVDKEKTDILNSADAVLEEELKKDGLYYSMWQAFCVFLPVKTVGVMGDSRTYENVIALRCVNSSDAMTAAWVRIPYDTLERISTRIVNEVRGVNRVVYDITNKPPGTIEWE